MVPRGDKESSAYEMFTGVKVDVSKQAKLCFGDYVQVHEDDMITNTMKERTVGALCLGPSGNVQGGYIFVSLATWSVIRRRSWTSLPIPKEIIDLVNSKVKEELELEEESEEEVMIEHEPTNNISGHLEQTEADGNQAVEVQEDNNSLLEEDIERYTPEIQRYQLRNRERLTNWRTKFSDERVMNISVKNAVKDMKEVAIVSMMKELEQMIKKDVFEPMRRKDVTGKIISSHMFVKIKRDGRVKSRLVANGKMQNRYGADTSSPTVGHESVLITLQVEAFEQRVVVSVDIDGAYLNADYKGDTYIRLDPNMVCYFQN
jgi:hypothetical protein